MTAVVQINSVKEKQGFINYCRGMQLKPHFIKDEEIEDTLLGNLLDRAEDDEEISVMKVKDFLKKNTSKN